MVFHGVAEISDEGYKTQLRRGWQFKRCQRRRAVVVLRRDEAIQIDAVMNGDDLALGDAFNEELLAHGCGVGDDGMREAVSLALDDLLRTCAPAGGFAPRRDAHTDAG